MGNYFNTINIAYKALQAQKKSLDVTGHNISNANTEGYSRQRAIHKASRPYAAPGMNMPQGAGQLGSGVEIEEISRIRDKFIDAQINQEKQSLGYWEKKQEGLERIEMIFNEPSTSSLDSAMTNFWNSLQNLSNSPEDSAVRETVKQDAQTLIDTFHSLHDRLSDYKISLNEDVATVTDDINSIADRIADLNSQIVEVKSSGQNPNDLMDERDLLLEDLNKLVKVQTNEDEKGNVNVSLGGTRIVSEDSTNHLLIKDNPDPTRKFEDLLYFEVTGNDAYIEGGELNAILELRGGYQGEQGDIARYIEQIDNLARTLVENFNNVHRGGYDLDGNHPAENFFEEPADISEVGSRNISLSDALLGSDGINKIAAGAFNDNPSAIEITDSSNIDINGYDVEIVRDTDDTNGIAFTITVTDADGDSVAGDISDVDFEDGTIISTDDLAGTIAGSFDFVVHNPGDAVIDSPGSYNPGSGDNAVHLSNVINKDKLFNNDTTTMEEAYQSIVSSLGVEGRRADRMKNNQETVINQLTNRRTSISGVSLDEEMANMIKFQQAYSAAAKVINTTDRILDSLMSIIR